MAEGYDKLLDFLLSEIALRGIQGASSADFRQLIRTFYNSTQNKDQTGNHEETHPTEDRLGRTFHEKVWQWLTEHPDIRIMYQNEAHRYSLSEFEAAELHETGTIGEVTSAISARPSKYSSKAVAQPSKALCAIEDALRQRISRTGQEPKHHATPLLDSSTTSSAFRKPRPLPKRPSSKTAVFDDPSSSITAPRLYASQSRMWQALTGHGIDLNKVPSMEFVLLSLIAAHGAAGIRQPDLIALSGQDKRSVPHRTDELARKCYIGKFPVQVNKMRTSLCIHRMFVSQNTVIESSAVEDVYQADGTFVVRSFAQLLYNKVGEGGVVPTRSIREKLGVPMETWNKRATQGALIRLDQSGMIKRRMVRTKTTGDHWITCIQVLRAPQEEDLKNLGFRRTADLGDDSISELPDGNMDEEALMRDLEADMLEETEAHANSQHGAQDAINKAENIPPQWTPDRFLANTVFDAVELGGAQGWDALELRDRIVGPFWRRPIESYLTRITNAWEKAQPIHIRHLAVIRDSGVTAQRKFLHYLYRTHANFQKAVDAGLADWDGVANYDADGFGDDVMLDAWGFSIVESQDLVGQNGSATLSEAGLSILKPRKNGPRWDIALAQEIGYEKVEKPGSKAKTQRGLGRPKKQAKTPKEKRVRVPKVPKPPKQSSVFSLSPEEKVSLGLHPNARLTKSIKSQVLAHREQTGDPTSLPSALLEGRTKRQLSVPLMTKEERLAAGLSTRGRLGIEQENKIRAERGLPKLAKKEKKRKQTNQPTVISKQQRIALGWIDHGRLPQALIEGLRQERDEGIAFEDSKVIPKYNDAMRAAKLAKMTKPAKLVKSTKSKGPTGLPKTPAAPTVEEGTLVENRELENTPDPIAVEPETQAQVSKLAPRKRKAKDLATTPAPAKKRRVKAIAPQDRASVPHTAQSPSTVDGAPMFGTSTSLGSTDVDGTSNQSQPTLVAIPVPVPLMPPQADESIVPSVESGNPQAPRKEAYMQPDPSKLDSLARTAFELYEKRSSSGLYLNPLVKRKIGRGRPRKAFIATFKLPELAQFDWFTTELDQEQIVPESQVVETPNRVSASLATPREETVDSHDTPRAEITPEAPFQSQSPSKEETREDVQNCTPPPSIASNTVLVESEELPIPSEVNSEALVQSTSEPLDASQDTQADVAVATGLTEGVAQPNTLTEDLEKQLLRACAPAARMIDTQADVHMVTGSTEGEPQPKNLTEDLKKQLPRPCAPVARMIGGWAPINASARSSTTPYRSPYATSPAPEARSPSQDASTTQNGRGLTPLAPDLQRSYSVFEDVASLPKDIHTAIVETPAPSIPGIKPRSKDQERGGSQLRFRQNIIMDIFKLCNGVFPGGGEIARPFLTLWKQRHPNIKAPSLSTITETLRTMSLIPKFGLKHWNFASYNKNTPGVTTRRMYTWASLNERSPQVQKLAFNMAQYSHIKEYSWRLSEKSLLYYPEEVRHLIGDIVSYQPVQAPPKDESIILNQLNPDLERQLDESKARRRSEWSKQTRLEVKARNIQNAQVERALSQQLVGSGGASHGKRARLASLNDTTKTLRRAPLYSADIDTLDEDSDEAETSEHDTGTSRPGQLSLSWVRPIVPHVPQRKPVPEDEESEDDESDEDPMDWTLEPVERITNDQDSPASTGPDRSTSAEDAVTIQKSKKRIRIVTPGGQSPRKRARNSTLSASQCGSDDDVQSDSYTEDETDDDQDSLQTKAKKQRVRAFRSRQNGRSGPPPTLIERLTGLTGDPNDPIYQIPQRASRPGCPSRSWSERKKRRVGKHKKERHYAEVIDPVDEVKKQLCTFVVISSLSGEDGYIDWSLVRKAHARDRFFDATKARKLWEWMQTNMAEQVEKLTTNFQSLYLEAYEASKVSPIENPETHDWAELVRWAVRKCTYPEIPLPLLQEALAQFTVQESNYENLDRVRWFKVGATDRNRAMLQLHTSYTAPLHRSRKATWSAEEKLLKARSWVRANTATSQAIYDGTLAHEKFKKLDETTLVNVVGDFVDKQHLRMRKLKRLLPGRNYNFTQALAKKYVRSFQLDDFMHAVAVKKRMDAAFSDADPGMRYYSISRCEEDASFAAVMTMVGEGAVRLVPQLPPVNSDHGAPLPRLSVWGFCEGGYHHRAIDRNRLFWDIHVVPTADYKFGNPLQPLSSLLASMDSDEHAVWSSLPEPPLPGKDNPDALLPIWSSIDGRTVTWPWWYRVLNLVLLPFIFLAGATAADIQAHCPENTTELFEIELVLEWLESINAIKKTVGGYITGPYFWAVFGDQLRDTENDWFGEHAKRKAKNHEKQRWREDYNLRHSTLQARNAQQDGGGVTSAVPAGETSTSRQILKNPKQQYRIVHEALDAERAQAEKDRSVFTARNSPTATQNQTNHVATTESKASASQTPEATSTSGDDVYMPDAGIDAEGEEDIDAEGEIDDGIY
ncbi:B-block-TFIIIC domain containing protein [Pyrenophora tritici-repentis]|nr:B-block-TFIIIC domain containing protein [Pyrenophora tritici-repentis]